MRKLLPVLALSFLFACEKEDSNNSSTKAQEQCATCFTVRATRYYNQGIYVFTDTTTRSLVTCGNDSIAYYNSLISSHMEWEGGGAVWDSASQSWVGDTSVYWTETTHCQ